MPDHVCSANISQSTSIGAERKWARESLINLKKDGINVNVLTTDPDSSVFLASEDLYMSGETSTIAKHQLDTRHVQCNQRKFMKSINFSKNMFNVRSEKEKNTKMGRFTHDLVSRCQAEHKLALSKFGGDTIKVSNKMRHMPEVLGLCYSGNHKLCRKHSLACRGLLKNNWLCRSAYLSKKFKITPNKSDTEKLKRCIEYRLGVTMLKKTKYLLTTQKCEAVNRAITSTAPKNVTFSRNYAGRVHAAVHGVNAGVSEAIISECQNVSAPITAGTRVSRRLLQIQKNQTRSKQIKNSKKAKYKRYMKRKKLYEMHENTKKETDIYQKNVCMPESEHSYCKPYRSKAKI